MIISMANETANVLAATVLFFPSLSVMARRLHDTDKSAWWLLLNFIPLIGQIVLLVFCASRGTASTTALAQIRSQKTNNLTSL